MAITFNSAPGMTTRTLQSGLTTEQTGVKPIAGLADAAFSFDPPGLGLTFLSGTTVSSILMTLPATADEDVALAKAILAGS